MTAQDRALIQNIKEWDIGIPLILYSGKLIAKKVHTEYQQKQQQQKEWIWRNISLLSIQIGVCVKTASQWAYLFSLRKWKSSN